ncbi:MAG TPA: hypothetical protein VHM89_01025 [Acidimicrobiales bacterium]|nr:hypothetical protein [Acidimicrobiales bacterium]
MKRIAAFGVATLVGSGFLGGLGGPVSANAADVVREGACSGGSTWKLKLSPENGAIETDFEVDQNVVGQEWRVVLEQNGTVVFRGKRTTQAPSGSFEVRRVLPDAAGTDTIAARATNLVTGEICKGRAQF